MRLQGFIGCTGIFQMAMVEMFTLKKSETARITKNWFVFFLFKSILDWHHHCPGVKSQDTVLFLSLASCMTLVKLLFFFPFLVFTCNTHATNNFNTSSWKNRSALQKCFVFFTMFLTLILEWCCTYILLPFTLIWHFFHDNFTWR